MTAAGTRPREGLAAVPGGVWALGAVSLLMDTSSELVHGLLPVFLVSVLGVGALSVGLIEGVAEATASIMRIFSGTLSDRTGRRKLLTVVGYGVSAATKPVFPLAGSLAWVLAARFTDRVGKGIRGAPRDALVGDLAPAHLRGAAYGLRQSLDTVGAFAGPLLAVGCMALFAGNIRAVFWVGVVPAVLAVAVLVLAVREPSTARPAFEARPARRADLRALGAAYWRLTAVAAVLALARFSEAFLVLRAADAGLATTLVPLVLVAMNVAYAASAYPAGRLSDRLGRRGVLAAGLALLVAADVVLAAAPGVTAVLAGVALWGLHMGLTYGILAAMVADAVPAARRGTAFGAFHLVTGLATLGASVGAGALWDLGGPAATFLAGAGVAALALGGVGWLGVDRAGPLR